MTPLILSIVAVGVALAALVGNVRSARRARSAALRSSFHADRATWYADRADAVAAAARARSHIRAGLATADDFADVLAAGDTAAAEIRAGYTARTGGDDR